MNISEINVQKLYNIWQHIQVLLAPPACIIGTHLMVNDPINWHIVYGSLILSLFGVRTLHRQLASTKP